jgi:hypothetical protein
MGGVKLYKLLLPANNMALAVEVYKGYKAVVKQLVIATGADANFKDKDSQRLILLVLYLSCLPFCYIWIIL